MICDGSLIVGLRQKTPNPTYDLNQKALNCAETMIKAQMPYRVFFPWKFSSDPPPADGVAVLFHDFNAKNNGMGSLFMAAYLKECGVPKEKVFIENHSWDTLSNIIGIRSIMADQQWRTLILVSAPDHLERRILNNSIDTFSRVSLCWCISKGKKTEKVSQTNKRRNNNV